MTRPAGTELSLPVNTGPQNPPRGTPDGTEPDPGSALAGKSPGAGESSDPSV